MMGHSLGEFTALCASDALTFPSALHLVRQRGLLMSTCTPPHTSAMVALIPCSLPFALSLCQSVAALGVCVVANINSREQVVLAGELNAVKRAVELGKEGVDGDKVKKAVWLDVSAPFHSPLMRPMVDEWTTVVSRANLHPPSVPIITNVTATQVTDVNTIRSQLVSHVTSPVLWYQSVMEGRRLGVEEFVEMGPSAVLGPLVTAIHRQQSSTLKPVHTHSLCSAEQVQSFLCSQAQHVAHTVPP
jgi:[acyl-carrier-protein] S-malonyltransferase